MAHELHIGWICELDFVFRSAQHRDEARRLFEQSSKTVALRNQLLAGAHLLCRFGADHQYAAYPMRGRLVVNRAVAIGPIYVVAPAMTGDRHKLVLVPSRAAPLHDLVNLRADDVPDFRPNLASGTTQGTGVSLRANRLAIGVVIEASAVLSPPDVHGMAGIQHQ